MPAGYMYVYIRVFTHLLVHVYMFPSFNPSACMYLGILVVMSALFPSLSLSLSLRYTPKSHTHTHTHTHAYTLTHVLFLREEKLAERKEAAAITQKLLEAAGEAPFSCFFSSTRSFPS